MEGVDYRRQVSTEIVRNLGQSGQKRMQLGYQREQVDDQHV